MNVDAIVGRAFVKVVGFDPHGAVEADPIRLTPHQQKLRQRRREVAECYDIGMKIEAIARRFDVTGQTIRNDLRAMGRW